jgi:hypothetical protein
MTTTATTTTPARRVEPSKRLFDPKRTFAWVPAVETDIRLTFERARAQLKEKQQ